MTRDSNIPLFLWIATAALAHLMWAGGADRVVSLLERRLALQYFLASVDARAKSSVRPVEVSLLQIPETPERPAEPPEESLEDEAEPPEVEKPPQPKPEPPRAAPPEEEKRVQKLELVKPAEQEKKKQKHELLNPDDRRIAVVQDVKDKNQEDNPNAEFIAEHANRVDAQTQARITSTDQNDPDPTPGSTHAGPTEFPGNSEQTRIAQSEDAPGEPDLAPDPVSHQAAKQPQQAQPSPEAAQPAKSQQRRQASRTAPEQPQPQTHPKPTDPAHVPNVVASRQGTFVLPSQRHKSSPETDKERRKPRPRPLDMLGLGETGTTDRGINLNLTTQSALAAIGRDALTSERKRDAERRLSEHRGSWKSLGIERWRSAIENYVPSVKLGNTTALNTARNPFANYLNHIHNRIHPIFADTFLVSLDRLPNSHPLNQPDLKTFLEIVVRETDGQLVRMGVTRTSGVTAFDIGALESVQRASPFGTPPAVIVSPDRNVYLHWEFHRNPIYACSTYFARPYILKGKPETAPPDVEPSPEPDLNPKELPPSDPRHGLWRGPAGGAARLARATHWWLFRGRAVF